MLTGHSYEIPKNQWRKSGNTYTFSGIPVYDSPVLIAEKSLVMITSLTRRDWLATAALLTTSTFGMRLGWSGVSVPPGAGRRVAGEPAR